MPLSRIVVDAFAVVYKRLVLSWHSLEKPGRVGLRRPARGACQTGKHLLRMCQVPNDALDRPAAQVYVPGAGTELVPLMFRVACLPAGQRNATPICLDCSKCRQGGMPSCLCHRSESAKLSCNRVFVSPRILNFVCMRA